MYLKKNWRIAHQRKVGNKIQIYGPYPIYIDHELEVIHTRTKLLYISCRTVILGRRGIRKDRNMINIGVPDTFYFMQH